MVGKVDLAASILQLVSKETSPDLLLEKLHLSSKILDEQIRMLKSRDLITVSKGGKSVSITKRGRRFLDLYDSIHSRYLTVQA